MSTVKRDTLRRLDIMETGCRFGKWASRIPSFQIPEHWAIKVTPPFCGAIVSYDLLNTKNGLTSSIVLRESDEICDFAGGAYWTVTTKYDASWIDGYKCPIDEVDELMGVVHKKIEPEPQKVNLIKVVCGETKREAIGKALKEIDYDNPRHLCLVEHRGQALDILSEDDECGYAWSFEMHDLKSFERKFDSEQKMIDARGQYDRVVFGYGCTQPECREELIKIGKTLGVSEIVVAEVRTIW